MKSKIAFNINEESIMAKKTVLNKIFDHFESNPKKSDKDYFIPSLWTLDDGPSRPVKVNANQYFKNIVSDILSMQNKGNDYSISIIAFNNVEVKNINFAYPYQKIKT